MVVEVDNIQKLCKKNGDLVSRLQLKKQIEIVNNLNGAESNDFLEKLESLSKGLNSTILDLYNEMEKTTAEAADRFYD